MMAGRRNICVQTVTLLVMLMVALPAWARPGSFSQTSFVSTSGVSSSGASESQVTHSNGTTTGECVYMDSQGRSIKIKYSNTPDGTLTASSDSTLVTDAKAELQRCREVVARISEEIQGDLTQHQRFFQEQQANLQKQQAEFMKQQEEFNRQMEAFRNQMQEEQQRLLEVTQLQQQQFFEQQEQLFQNLYKTSALTFP